MSKGLEYLTYEESMKESALFSQEKKKAQVLFVSFSAFVCILDWKEEGARLFSVKWTRQDAVSTN